MILREHRSAAQAFLSLCYKISRLQICIIVCNIIGGLEAIISEYNNICIIIYSHIGHTFYARTIL